MQNGQVKQPKGSLKISQGVIASIASRAAAEIAGVVPLETGPSIKGLVSRPLSKPVVIRFVDDMVEISLTVSLLYGTRIPEATEAVQESVKETVQNMTGITVSKVNVYIAGLLFEEKADGEE